MLGGTAEGMEGYILFEGPAGGDGMPYAAYAGFLWLYVWDSRISRAESYMRTTDESFACRSRSVSLFDMASPRVRASLGRSLPMLS